MRPRGLAVEGWIPVERSNFATRFGDVYAVGDVAGAPVAKAGVFAESAAAVVAADIAARLHDEVLERPWDGADHCYIEFGAGAVGKVEANFLGGPAPSARLVGPSPELAAERRPSARPDGSAGSGELGGEVMAALNRSIANDQDALEAWGRFFRLPASPAVTSAVTRMLLELDIRDVLPAISSPTLLLHRHGNPLFPPEAGRNVARRVDKHAQQPTN